MTTQSESPLPAVEKRPPPDAPLASPFSGGGLMDVFRSRYLLKLLVQKELTSRYQGSVLGLLWSYVLPLVRFSMYFFVIGLILGLHADLPNFAIHLFCAMVGVHFFTETFSAGTRAIVKNKALVRKMAMPREMFPVATVIVSAVNTFPQILILFIASIAVGWRPDTQGVFALFLGFAIITVLGTALALLFSAMNVFFKDFQNIVATFMLFTHWIVPMMYPFSRLATSSMGDTWFYYVYLSNPLTIAVILIQRGIWIPTFPDCSAKVTTYCLPGGDPSAIGYPDLPHHLYLLGWVMLAVSFIILVFCQRAFSRLEGKFAERL